jgi:hypothetical protein
MELRNDSTMGCGGEGGEAGVVVWLTTKYWQRTVHMDSEEPVKQC